MCAVYFIYVEVSKNPQLDVLPQNILTEKLKQ